MRWDHRVLQSSNANRLAAAAVAAAFSVALASPVRAQVTVAEDPAAVGVRIGGTVPGLRYQLRHAEGGPVWSCDVDCQLRLYPGKYDLRVFNASGHVVLRKRLRLDDSVELAITPPNEPTRSLGLAAGIGGSAIASVGLAWAFFQTWADTAECYDGCTGREYNLTLPALVFVGGAAISIAGWVTFANNRGGIEKQPLYARTRAPGVNLGFALGPRFSGGALSLRF
jgi:hypothetical protein